MSNTQTPTPSCKFCQGAGESKAVYTSHWQFSKPVDGKLICPKLLGHKCKLCNETGHIEKRCPFPRKKQQQQQEQSKFCRFCCNAGHSEYTEHNQFDKDGFVTCPALINIECQQCGKKGHTKKYCAVAAVVTPKKAEKIITAPKKPANKFAALLVEEDEAVAVPLPDIDILQSKNLEKFPCLPTGGAPSKVSALTGWAKMAAMPAKKMAPIIAPVVVVKNEARLAEYDGLTDDEVEDVHHDDDGAQTESTSWADW